MLVPLCQLLGLRSEAMAKHLVVKLYTALLTVASTGALVGDLDTGTAEPALWRGLVQTAHMVEHIASQEQVVYCAGKSTGPGSCTWPGGGIVCPFLTATPFFTLLL